MPVNAAGETKATYRYNAWGALVYSSGTDNIHEINPLRYRGYYYDTETGFYYLQSRYYDPAICRFINADGYASTGQGFTGANMFAYCLNNPIVFVDPNGTDAVYVLDYEELPVFGHSVLFVQDENGTWYRTECLKNGAERGSPTKVETRAATLDEIRSLTNDRRFKIVHIEGDFSKSVDLAKQYAEKGYGTYKFIWNNCKDYAQEILSMGDYDHSLEELGAKLEFSPSPALYFSAIGFASYTSQVAEGVWNYAKKMWSFIQEAVR